MYNFLKTYVFPIFVENFTVYTVRKRDYKFYSPVGCTVHCRVGYCPESHSAVSNPQSLKLALLESIVKEISNNNKNKYEIQKY